MKALLKRAGLLAGSPALLLIVGCGLTGPVERYPGERWEVHTVAAMAESREGRWEEAERSHLAAVASVPSVAGNEERLGVSLRLLADVYAAAGRSDAAASTLEKAVALEGCGGPADGEPVEPCGNVILPPFYMQGSDWWTVPLLLSAGWMNSAGGTTTWVTPLFHSTSRYTGDVESFHVGPFLYGQDCWGFLPLWYTSSPYPNAPSEFLVLGGLVARDCDYDRRRYRYRILWIIPIGGGEFESGALAELGLAPALSGG